jgi:hypothetical protein
MLILGPQVSELRSALGKSKADQSQAKPGFSVKAGIGTICSGGNKNAR